MHEPTIGLFFEVDPLPKHSERYFDLAAVLRPELEKNPGLIFIDRYLSIDRPNIVLSHSWWESEETLIEWRQHTRHRAFQRAGREQRFQDYRLRIGRLLSSSAEMAPARLLCVSYLEAEPCQRDHGELFKSGVLISAAWLHEPLGPFQTTTLICVVLSVALAVRS